VAVQAVALVLEDTRQAKVGDLQVTRAADKQVGWLQILTGNTPGYGHEANSPQ